MDQTRKERRIAAPGRTRQILQQHGLKLKKSLGQNFLTDANILAKITAAAQLSPADGVLEIGPGIGALTEQLAAEAGKVVAVELDQRLIPILDDLFSDEPKVTIVHGDILELELEKLYEQHFANVESVHVVANLPYYITTPILFKLLHAACKFDNIVVMIQKEVAERLAAKPGSKAYGSLSVAVQYYSEPEIVASVPPAVFVPPPQVGSSVIRLKSRQSPPVSVQDESFFFDVVKASFAQRRKTIYNNLLSRYYTKAEGPRLKELLVQAGIDPGRRGETLSIEEYAKLSDLLRNDVK